jgi:two-component system, LytTR family, sensor kinase
MNSASANLLDRRWVRWALYLGFWTALGLVNAGQSYFIRAVNNQRPHPWAFVLGLTDWYLWAALTPFIFSLGRRWPMDRRHWPVSLPVHLAACFLCTLLVVAITTEAFLLLAPEGEESSKMTYGQLFRLELVGYLVVYLWVYGGILGVGQAVEYYRRFRERELRASRLEARLAQARLEVLKMQLHPHFLFNTLNTISALMHQDIELADRMVARLGDLLRATLENAGAQEVPLRKELEFIRPYLEIEQARLGDRLSVTTDVDPGALDASVPYLLLQPLIENAVRHGIAPYTSPGRVEIRARRDNGELRLEVRDNGPGLSADQQRELRSGVGVANVKARLEHLYGTAQHFEMANQPGGGLAVTVRVPYREDNSPPLATREGVP